MSTYRKQHYAAGSSYGRRGFDLRVSGRQLAGLGGAVARLGRTVAGAFAGHPAVQVHIGGTATGLGGAGRAAARPGATAAATAPTVRPGGGVDVRRRKAGELFPSGFSSGGEAKTPLFPQGFASGGGVQESPGAGVQVIDFAAAGQAVGGVGRTAAGAAAGAGTAAAGEAVGGLAAAAGAVATGFGAVVAAGAEVANRLNQLSAAAIVANESFRDVSPAMAQVFQSRDTQRTFRDMQKGNALSESAGALIQAEQRKEDNTKDVEVLIGAIQNNVSAGWEELKAALFLPVNELAKAVNELLGIGKRKDGEPIGFGDWMEEIRKNAEEARRKKEERLKAPQFQDAPNDRGRLVP